MNNEENIIAFEKEYGTELLLKVCVSTINRILVEKGIVSEKELTELFSEGIAEVEDEKECPTCNGFGYIETNEDCVDISDYTPPYDCPDCGGTGKIF